MAIAGRAIAGGAIAAGPRVSIVAGSLAETFNISDTYLSNFISNNTIQETIVLVDTVSGLVAFVGSVLESSEISDLYESEVIVGSQTYYRNLSEEGSLSDSYVSVLIAQGTVSESGEISDNLTSIWSGYVTIEESLTFGFTVSGSILSSGGGTGGGTGGIRTVPLGEDYTFMVRMVSDSDHTTGVQGLTLSFSASKAGGPFSTLSPTVVDRGAGWYAVTISGSDLDTEGDYVFTIQASGADNQAVTSQVMLGLQDAVLAALQQSNLLTVGKFLALK